MTSAPCATTPEGFAGNARSASRRAAEPPGEGPATRITEGGIKEALDYSSSDTLIDDPGRLDGLAEKGVYSTYSRTRTLICEFPEQATPCGV